MANICTSTYRITGDTHELNALHNLMLQLQREKENGNWVGHIVEHLNGNIPEHIYARGWWSSLKREEDCLYFEQESAWEPLIETWDFIASKFSSLQVYFIGEESGCDIFIKRDHPEKRWFTDNYCVDMCTPEGVYSTEYYETIDEAFRAIEAATDTNIFMKEDVEAIHNVWTDNNPDHYIYFNEFETV